MDEFFFSLFFAPHSLNNAPSAFFQAWGQHLWYDEKPGVSCQDTHLHTAGMDLNVLSRPAPFLLWSSQPETATF